MTLRVKLLIDPKGDKTKSRDIGEIEIINVTRSAGRMSDDYLWRIRTTSASTSKQVDAVGYVVDSYHGSVIELLYEVLAEWKSGRPLPTDNHGLQTLPEGIKITATELWKYLDDLEVPSDEKSVRMG